MLCKFLLAWSATRPDPLSRDQHATLSAFVEGNCLLSIVYGKECEIIICICGEVLWQDYRMPVLLGLPTSLSLYFMVSLVSLRRARGACYLTCSNIKEHERV
jgi:hypothetical protein